MPHLETTPELAERIADLCGVYGAGPCGDHPEDCRCRMCFVDAMLASIHNAVRNDRVLAVKWEQS